MKTLFDTTSRDIRGLKHLMTGSIKFMELVDIRQSRFFTPSYNKNYDGFAWDGYWYLNGNKIINQRASWAEEGGSATRGELIRFPEQFYILVSEGDLTIINAKTLNIWMRFLSPLVQSDNMFNTGYWFFPHPAAMSSIPVVGEVMMPSANPDMFVVKHYISQGDPIQVYINGVLQVGGYSVGINTVTFSSTPGYTPVINYYYYSGVNAWDSKIIVRFCEGVLICMVQIQTLEPIGDSSFNNNYFKTIISYDFTKDEIMGAFGSVFFGESVFRIKPCETISKRNDSMNVPLFEEWQPVEQCPLEPEDNFPSVGREIFDIIPCAIDGEPYFILLESYGLTVLRRNRKVYHYPSTDKFVCGVINPKTNTLYLGVQRGGQVHVASWSNWNTSPSLYPPYTTTQLVSSPNRSMKLNDMVFYRDHLYLATNLGLFESSLDLSITSLKVSSEDTNFESEFKASTEKSYNKLALDPETGLLGILSETKFYEMNLNNGQIQRTTDLADFSCLAPSFIMGVPA